MVMEPMSERTAAVGNCLFCTVLPSAHLVVTVGGLSKDQVKRGLRELKEREFVEIHELGVSAAARSRGRLDGAGPGPFRGHRVAEGLVWGRRPGQSGPPRFCQGGGGERVLRPSMRPEAGCCGKSTSLNGSR